MYTFESRIGYSEAGKSGKLSLDGLLNYFQDCSFFHSEDMGVGLHFLNENHLAWVLSSWQIVVNRYPMVCETVRVGTAPYDFRGFFGYRNFLLETLSGERLACANSIWTLLDTRTMRPVKAPAEMVNAYRIEEKIEMEYAPRKISIPEGGSLAESIVVRSHHLDTNQHVNNGQYVRMAADCLSGEESIIQMRAEYRKSAVLHDVIVPLKIKMTDNIYVIVLQDEKEVPFCIVEFTVTI